MCITLRKHCRGPRGDCVIHGCAIFVDEANLQASSCSTTNRTSGKNCRGCDIGTCAFDIKLGFATASQSPTVVCIEEAGSALMDVRRPKSAGSQGESGLGNPHAGQSREQGRCPQACSARRASLRRHSGSNRMARAACCSVRQSFETHSKVHLRRCQYRYGSFHCGGWSIDKGVPRIVSQSRCCEVRLLGLCRNSQHRRANSDVLPCSHVQRCLQKQNRLD